MAVLANPRRRRPATIAPGRRQVNCVPPLHEPVQKKLGSGAKTHGSGIGQYRNLLKLYVSRTKPTVEGRKLIVGSLKRIVVGSNRHWNESFPCGSGPFPCGNESIPHGKIEYRCTRLILQ